MSRYKSETEREPLPSKQANRPQYALIEASEKVGFDLTEPLMRFVPSVWADAKVKGDQWRIAQGDAIAKLGTSTGSPAQDRAIAYERLTGLSDWAEQHRNDPRISTAINQSRQVLKQHDRLTRQASRLDVAAIRIGDKVLNEETLGLVYEEPFDAMLAMREIVGETASYQAVVDALVEDPAQFGTIRRRSALSTFLNRGDDLSAQSTLEQQIIPDLRDASVKQKHARRARRSAEQLMEQEPPNVALVEFADALEAMNRRLIAPEFAAVEADITAHKQYELLLGHDPVGALELAQAKAMAPDGSRLWHDIAEVHAENIRDNDQLALEAKDRGIIPEMTMPRNAGKRPGPPPAPRQ